MTLVTVGNRVYSQVVEERQNGGSDSAQQPYSCEPLNKWWGGIHDSTKDQRSQTLNSA